MSFLRFAHHEILGINARNLLYIKPYNSKKAIAFADDKLKTKMFLGSRGIPVAKVYARIETRRQARLFDFSILPDICVLKPNAGFGGEGIIILRRGKNGVFLDNGKTPLTEGMLREHIEDILDGKYSISGQGDIAFFEQMLVADPCFAPLRPAGLPDIRVIVFNLVPVMAMLRIPTTQSGGKANVHLGGIGIGIDMATGITTKATQFNHLIHALPHGEPCAGFRIADWEKILLISARIQQMTNLGYLAADFTIDEEMGPVLLEVNARAGLMVQIANLAPLRSRLERVRGLKVGSPEKGVRIGQDLFGRAQRPIVTATGDAPTILGPREMITVTGKKGSIDLPCRIDVEREGSVCNPVLLQTLRDLGAVEEEEGTHMLHLKFTLGGKKVRCIVQEADIAGPEHIVIGHRDLDGFLIDPKRRKAIVAQSHARQDLHAADRLLARIDRELSLLPLLKPVNLLEERERALEQPTYSPLFQFSAMPEGMEEIEERLRESITDDSPLGKLLEKKRLELLGRILLLQSRGDAQAFTSASAALFPLPDAAIILRAEQALETRQADEKEKLLSACDAQERLVHAVEQYGLHEWQVVLRKNLVADCTVGGNVIALRANARFSAMHIESLIAHEIEVHALTSVNGVHQPWLLLQRGTANYLETQEGLAIWSQNRVLPPKHRKRLGPARSLLAVHYALTHGFAQTRQYLEEELGYSSEKALTKTIDVKRGLCDTSAPGAFSKGVVYFRGAESIVRYCESGGNLRRLFIGKVTLSDLDLLEQIPGLRPPLVLPEWLREKAGPSLTSETHNA